MSGSIGTSTRAYTPPVSSPSSTAIRHTPVSVSPASSARSTGAAPRHRGSSEKCRLTIGTDASTWGLMILPEGDDDTQFGADREHVVDVV